MDKINKKDYNIIMIPSKKSIINALIKNGVNKKDISNAEKIAKETKKSFEEVLIEQKIIDFDQFNKIKAELSKIPEANLPEFGNINLISLLPESIILNSLILPFKKNENELHIAMNDPWNEELIEFIKKRTGMDLIIYYAPKEKILNCFNQTKNWAKNLLASSSEIIKSKEDIAESTIKIIDTIIHNAIESKASDIHIEPQENEVVVRYRIDGILKDVANFPKEEAGALIARIKVLSNLKLDEHRLPQDGRFKENINNKKYSFRVSIMPIFDGEKAAIRILEEEGKIYSLEELGFQPNNIEILKKAIERPYGMILATGPTGSGKTTTLYTLLKMINKREINIVTVEDPIEYRLEGANQTQIKPEIGLTFANGLRSILRQDPNVIMVGEIRDNETAALAINAALTGHLVFSTLHTNDAAGALPRLIDMKIESFLIASTVNVIIAQRLIRKLDPETKIAYKLSEEEYKELEKIINTQSINEKLKKIGIISEDQTFKNITWYKPGTSKKNPDGYKDRIGIHEVLEVNDEIRKLIFNGANADEIRKTAQKNGMITIQEDGFIKAAMGITSIEEVIRATKE